MLINLVPDFLAVVSANDPVAAYRAYFAAHERLLRSYWRNYVIDPDEPQFADISRATATARRGDLYAMLDAVDVVSIARAADAQCRDVLDLDVDFDIVLMVGVGAANAGELVVDGKGTAFVCLEHFTGAPNPDTHALGLEPELIPMWLAHGIAHVVRYTSPTSRSLLRTLISEAGGYYDYWETARRAPLRELVLNEGLAVQAARLLSPGHAAWEYFGYSRKEYARVRALSGTIERAVAADFDRAALGLRLRYLLGGSSVASRSVDRVVLPERAGYFVGARLVEAAIARYGLAWAVRASADELVAADRAARTA